eukprot:NODE_498_length_7675_cov_0.481389.p1 type:complete len:363 gc:universal NODE_498_length_7675_cov_0.481389:4252-3164(-)
MFKRIALLPGDGIGVTVINAAKQVLQAIGKYNKQEFEFVYLDAGFNHFKKTGHALPQSTITALSDMGKSENGKILALFGAVSSPSHKVQGYKSPIVQLRKLFNCYANIRPVKGIFNKMAFDMVIMRENTECLYVQDEELLNDKAIAKRIITKAATEKIARKSFEIARQRTAHKQAKVSIIHKANVLAATDGLFRETCFRIAENEFKAIKIGHPGWEKAPLVYNEVLVDAALYHMIRDPSQFDVLCCPNLYGDLLSDAGAGLVGSLGLIPSVNYSEFLIMGEPVHGSAPDIDPANANPIAAIRSAALMCRFANIPNTPEIIESAVNKAIENNDVTADCGGTLNCQQVTEKVISYAMQHSIINQ